MTESSEGNALYVRELVLGALESGTLQLDRGLWRLTGRPPVSRSLVELVASRMSELAPRERAPIELLAVGEPLRLGEIAALTDYEALVAAESLGLVVVAASADEVRLAHPRLRRGGARGAPDAARARAAPPRSPGRSGSAGRSRRATRCASPGLLLDAGAPIPSELRVDAARAANLAGDPELGAQLAESALADGAGLPAALLLARAHTARKRFADAEAVLAAVASLAGPDDDGIDYLEQRAHALFWGLDRPRGHPGAARRPR